jgi:hypothetical protein
MHFIAPVLFSLCLSQIFIIKRFRLQSKPVTNTSYNICDIQNQTYNDLVNNDLVNNDLVNNELKVLYFYGITGKPT